MDREELHRYAYVKRPLHLAFRIPLWCRLRERLDSKPPGTGTPHMSGVYSAKPLSRVRMPF